jgi:predicted nucleic acid-binding protein
LPPAIQQVEAWFESPSLVLLAETEGYWPELRVTLEQGRISGPPVHDARVAAIRRDHGVRELWTSDRDFSRFPQLTVFNPLVA